MLQTQKTGDGKIHHVVNKKEMLNLKNQIMVKKSRSLNERHQNRSNQEVKSILEDYELFYEELLEDNSSYGYVVARNRRFGLTVNTFTDELHYPYRNESLDNKVSVYQSLVVNNYRKMKDKHLIKNRLKKEFSDELKNKTVFFVNFEDSLLIGHCDPNRLVETGRDKSEYIDWFNKHVINVLDILRL